MIWLLHTIFAFLLYLELDIFRNPNPTVFAVKNLRRMKKNTRITILSLLALTFLWSCEQETIYPDDNTITARAPGNGNGQGQGNGGAGNGGSDGGAAGIWEVVYDGNVITSDPAYVKVEREGGKTVILSEACGGISTALYGLNDLFTLSGLNPDCYDAHECSVWIEVRQFDRKKLPERLVARFSFTDQDAAPGDGISFAMYGTKTGDFPPTGITTISFDKWAVSFGANGGGAACERANDFFTNGIANQSMTMRLVDQDVEGDIAALCGSKDGCVDPL